MLMMIIEVPPTVMHITGSGQKRYNAAAVLLLRDIPEAEKQTAARTAASLISAM
jgi:hypothetical protein